MHTHVYIDMFTLAYSGSSSSTHIHERHLTYYARIQSKNGPAASLFGQPADGHIKIVQSFCNELECVTCSRLNTRVCHECMIVGMC